MVQKRRAVVVKEDSRNRQKYPRIISKVPLDQQLNDRQKTSLDLYRQKVFSEKSYFRFLCFELAVMFSGNLQGGIGYLLRKKMLGLFFKNIGSGIILGKGITYRHPGQISMGNNVAIDDYVLLDAGGAGEKGIILSNEVIISRNCVVQGKTGPVFIGAGSDIGCNTVISSASGVYIGCNVLVAAHCYIGGAQYVFEDLEIPIKNQGRFSKDPVYIGDGSWLGAGVIVLDGVQIGQGCIIGAGAVVGKNLPENTVACGVPAKVMRRRDINCKQ